MAKLNKIGSYNEALKGKEIFDKIFNELGLEQDMAGGRSPEDCDRMDAKFEQLASRLEKEWTTPNSQHKDPPPVPADFTIAQGVAHVVAQLTPQDIAYANDPQRGSYRGFAALHDLCDANMLLPIRGNDDHDPSNQQEIDYLNAVIAGVNDWLASH
jgi:hypothetical protein